MNLRALRDDDWPRFEAFASKHFGQSHNIDRAFNEHWFRTSRCDGWAIRILEDATGDFVGVITVIVVPARFAGRDVLLGWISSGAVEESARARGAGARLLLWAYQTFPLIGAMSGNEFSTPLHDLLGIAVSGLGMRRFIYIHDQRAANLCRSAERAAVIAAAVSKSARARGGSASGCKVAAIPHEYEALWARFADGLMCTTVRDRAYLRWRYVDAPYIPYQFVELRDGAALHALAVFRFQPTPEGLACRIVEFVADPDWAADGWRSVLDIAEAEGALFSDFMVIGCRHDASLLDAGFVPADSKTGLNAVPHLLSPVEHRQWSNTFHLGGQLARADASWRRPEAVYFTKGDGDRDWPTTYDLRRQLV